MNIMYNRDHWDTELETLMTGGFGLLSGTTLHGLRLRLPARAAQWLLRADGTIKTGG